MDVPAEILSTAGLVALAALWWFLFLTTLLWNTIGFAGLLPLPKKGQAIPETLFVCLVPAHNEERVIGKLVESLNRQRYPSELVRVVVVADGCTDGTADAARSAGATVWVRHGDTNGKGEAIRYGVERLAAEESVLLRDHTGPVAVCVFDADNVVHQDFLREMNACLLQGKRVIQGYLDIKNPHDNWITRGYAGGYWHTNRHWQFARSKLGLSAAIGGTGFCVEWGLLRSKGWKYTTLTEDLEFQVDCLLDGVIPAWAHHAKVYDEKPTKLVPSLRQRSRWMRGHWQTCFRYLPRLVARGIVTRNLAMLDAALYLLAPGRLLTSSLVLFLSFLFAIADIHVLPWYTAQSLHFYVGMFVLGSYVSYFTYACWVDGWGTRLRVFYWIPTFLYSLPFIPLSYWGLLTARRRKWTKTEHTRALSVEDVVAPARGKELPHPRFLSSPEERSQRMAQLRMNRERSE